jgi:hypothetical protein
MDSPPCAAVSTPQPIATTNTAAQPRNAIAVMPFFNTTPNVDSLYDGRISETSQHGPPCSIRIPWNSEPNDRWTGW